MKATSKYTGLGVSYPGELVPTVEDGNVDTLTPIGDRFDRSADVLRIAPDPPPSPKPARDESKFQQERLKESPVGEISDALANANPKQLEKALKDLKRASPAVKMNAEKAVDTMIKADGIEAGGGSGAVTTTTPSPNTASRRTSAPGQQAASRRICSRPTGCGGWEDCCWPTGETDEPYQ